MARIGYGYGSECHLLRWMGRHRQLFERNVRESIGRVGTGIQFLDSRFKPGGLWPDKELEGMDFLPENHPVRSEWLRWWPQTGNVPNWDAVGKLITNSGEEWLLIEAKAHLNELETTCGAKGSGGLGLIRQAFRTTIERLGIRAEIDSWLTPYYQHANRLAALSFLHCQGVRARLVNVYFVGDVCHHGRICPQTINEWLPHIRKQEYHLGIYSGHALTPFVHTLFLGVAGAVAR